MTGRKLLPLMCFLLTQALILKMMKALAEAINQARRSYNRTRVIMPIAGEREITTEDTSSIQFVSFIRPTPTLSQYVRNYGFVNITLDQDSVLRWQPMLAQSGDDDPI